MDRNKNEERKNDSHNKANKNQEYTLCKESNYEFVNLMMKTLVLNEILRVRDFKFFFIF